MTSVRNNTERQFNLKAIKGNTVVVVRLVPGLNTVDDSDWKVIEKVPFLVQCVDKGFIEYGTGRVENAVLEETPVEVETSVKPISARSKKAREELNKEAKLNK